MPVWAHLLALAILSVLLIPASARAAGRAFTWQDLARYESSRDGFLLRDELAGADTSRSAALAGRAYLDQAFGNPDASIATIARVLRRTDVPDSEAIALRVLQIEAERRAYRYADGLVAARHLLADSSKIRVATLHDVRNDLRILSALEHSPPQMVVRRGDSHLQLVDGRIPVAFADSLRYYVFDTGANLSTIMRSEALRRGMRVLPAGIDVGTSTDVRVTADLAVAESLTIGAMQFRHVVFLVLDDSLLTFGDFRIPGIIGFPVIEQMGEVHWRGDSEVFVPASWPRRPNRNLAYSNLNMITIAQWHSARLLCRVDTGANRTQLYEPFYRRMSLAVDSLSRPWTRSTAGAGGERRLPVRVLGPLELHVGDAVARLDSLDVLQTSIASDEQANYLDGNLGHDVFDQFAELIVDFRDMAIVLLGRRP
jgi:hypothetical protein